MTGKLITKQNTSNIPIQLPEICTNEFWEVKPAGPGRGLGVFAIKDLKQGTRILAEKPQLTIDLSAFSRTEIRLGLETHHLAGTSTCWTDEPNANIRVVRSIVWSAFDLIPANDKSRIQALHAPEGHSGDWKRDVLAIVRANGFNHGHNGAAVCAGASRFNHSCVPNAHFAWNETLGVQTFQIVGLGGVRRGEEITVCYDEPDAEFAVRQRHLMGTYGFECCCEVCVGGGTGSARARISARRRREMGECREGIEVWEVHPSEAGIVTGRKDPLGLIERLRVLLVEEGLVGLVLARCLRLQSRWLWRVGKTKKAREAAVEEMRVVVYCVGLEHPKAIESREWFEGLK